MNSTYKGSWNVAGKVLGMVKVRVFGLAPIWGSWNSIVRHSVNGTYRSLEMV